MPVMPVSLRAQAALQSLLVTPADLYALAYWGGWFLLGWVAAYPDNASTGGWWVILLALVLTSGKALSIDRVSLRMQPTVTILIIAVAAWVNRNTGFVLTSYLVAPNFGAPGGWSLSFIYAGEQAVAMVLTSGLLAALFVRSLGSFAPQALVAAVLAPAMLLLLRPPINQSVVEWNIQTGTMLCHFGVMALAASAFARRFYAGHGTHRDREQRESRLCNVITHYLDGGNYGWVHLFAVPVTFALLLFTQDTMLPRLDQNYYAPDAKLALSAIGVCAIFVVTFLAAWRALAVSRIRHVVQMPGRLLLCIFGLPFGLLVALPIGDAAGAMLLESWRTTVNPLYRIDVNPDRQEITVSGVLSDGLAADLVAALRNNPHIRTLKLNSPGGLMSEASAAAQLVHSMRLTTIVEQDCMSACTSIFVGGVQRILMPSGRLGFHGASLRGAIDPDLLSELNASGTRELTAHGIDRAFALKAQSTPNIEMWFPTRDELRRANVITGTERPQRDSH